MQLFLDYVCENFWDCPDCVQWLCCTLTSAGDFETMLTSRCRGRYNQLFDFEDNSFFAEKLYNYFTIHKCLLVSKMFIIIRYFNNDTVYTRCETAGFKTVVSVRVVIIRNRILCLFVKCILETKTVSLLLKQKV